MSFNIWWIGSELFCRSVVSLFWDSKEFSLFVLGLFMDETKLAMLDCRMSSDKFIRIINLMTSKFFYQYECNNQHKILHLLQSRCDEKDNLKTTRVIFPGPVCLCYTKIQKLTNNFNSQNKTTNVNKLSS
jgi:hypothetical protein